MIVATKYASFSVFFLQIGGHCESKDSRFACGQMLLLDGQLAGGLGRQQS